jgi:hypothetical protein
MPQKKKCSLGWFIGWVFSVQQVLSLIYISTKHAVESHGVQRHLEDFKACFFRISAIQFQNSFIFQESRYGIQYPIIIEIRRLWQYLNYTFQALLNSIILRSCCFYRKIHLKVRVLFWLTMLHSQIKEYFFSVSFTCD